MKSLIKYSMSLLLTLCGLCAFAVLAADGKPDPLTRASIFIDAGRLKDAVALLKTPWGALVVLARWPGSLQPPLT